MSDSDRVRQLRDLPPAEVLRVFDEIVDPQINRDASGWIAGLMDVSAEVGPRPDAKTPRLVTKLWT